MSTLKLLAVVCLFLAAQVQGILVNKTLDDSDGSLVYLPPSAWNTPDCPTCTAKPDPALVFGGTWHDSTFNPVAGSNDFPNTVLSVSATFNGTAIYVYCVLADTVASPTGNSDMTFLIDGAVAGTFVKAPPGTDGYEYNQLVFSKTNIVSGFHTLTIQNGHVDGLKSLIILDSIVYSFDNGVGNHQTTSGVSIGLIVGVVVGALVVIALGIGLFFFCRRRKRRETEQSRLTINTFDMRSPVPIHSAQPITYQARYNAPAQQSIYSSGGGYTAASGHSHDNYGDSQHSGYTSPERVLSPNRAPDAARMTQYSSASSSRHPGSTSGTESSLLSPPSSQQMTSVEEDAPPAYDGRWWRQSTSTSTRRDRKSRRVSRVPQSGSSSAG
ncbi:hypothetical protein C8J56DRAFT_296376 [Mycena floridula]|nr:hypothetical protein C8J56DRAFT_296376 [Mycena floridula]